MKALIWIIVLIAVIGGIWYFMSGTTNTTPTEGQPVATEETQQPTVENAAPSTEDAAPSTY